MPRATALDTFARFAAGVTRRFPRKGAKALDAVLYPLLGNPLLVGHFRRQNRRNLSRIKKFDHLLVISDIHIGDAILFQTAVSALRDFFPKARIDYLVKSSVKTLLEGHPDITDLWPVFTGGQFPSAKDNLTVQAMAAEYDAVFNFSPFFPASLFPERRKVFHFTSHAPVFVLNEGNPGLPNHITYQAHRFIYDLLSPRFPIERARPFEGPGVFLPPGAVAEAHRFLEAKPANRKGPVLFLNPDTASPYTRVPVRYLTRLLVGLAGMRLDPQGEKGKGVRGERPLVLLGEGHTDKGIGEKLMFSLPALARDQVKVVPANLSLEAYAVLVDMSDVFISGDTGPLHLAAAWKKDKGGKHPFRNRTTILSLFGATPPRFSGYDSRPGFLESGQSAEAHSFQSESPCRNLSCMHKMGKDCDASGCFQNLDVEAILSQIRGVLLEKKAVSHTS